MAGVATVDTPYTLFLDNDAELASGALAALLRCAELTDASFVATLCLNRDRTLHYSGGRARLVDGALLEERPYGRLPAAEVLPHLKRSPTDAPELHGVLVHTQRLADAGGLDPELSSSMDCIDLGLRLNHVAGGGWLEPEAALTYHRYAPGPTDLRIYLDRWSRATIDHDIEHFARTWQVDLQCEGLEPHRESLGERRWRPFRYLRGGIRRALGDRAVARLDRLLDPQIDRLSTVHRQGGVPW
jgi:hypothetical protein